MIRTTLKVVHSRQANGEYQRLWDTSDDSDSDPMNITVRWR